MNDRTTAQLKELITRYGPDTLTDPIRGVPILQQEWGGDPLEPRLLTAALQANIPAELRHVVSTPMDIHLDHLTRKLTETGAFPPEIARDGIEAWAVALGVLTPAQCLLYRPESASPAATAGNVAAGPSVLKQKPILDVDTEHDPGGPEQAALPPPILLNLPVQPVDPAPKPMFDPPPVPPENPRYHTPINNTPVHNTPVFDLPTEPPVNSTPVFDLPPASPANPIHHAPLDNAPGRNAPPNKTPILGPTPASSANNTPVMTPLPAPQNVAPASPAPAPPAARTASPLPVIGGLLALGLLTGVILYLRRPGPPPSPGPNPPPGQQQGASKDGPLEQPGTIPPQKTTDTGDTSNGSETNGAGKNASEKNGSEKRSTPSLPSKEPDTPPETPIILPETKEETFAPLVHTPTPPKSSPPADPRDLPPPTRWLAASDLAGMSAMPLRRLRNEPYARHGYRFHDPELLAYFQQKSWYHPLTGDPAWVWKRMDATERHNAGLILDYQKQHGMIADTAGARPPSRFDSLMQQISRRTVTASDLAGLSATELKRLRNEPYARHGYRFHDPDLLAYFQQKSWYHPFSGDQATIEPLLSRTERQNVEAIRQFQQQHNLL